MIKYAIDTVRYWAARLHDDERGQDLIEYAMLGGLIAITLTAVAVLTAMSGAVEAMAGGIGACIDFDSTSACDPF